jgi:hypothetical protein
LIDKENIYFIASWDTAQMNDIEVSECCDLVAEVMRKLASEENWHQTIGSVFKPGSSFFAKTGQVPSMGIGVSFPDSTSTSTSISTLPV